MQHPRPKNSLQLSSGQGLRSGSRQAGQALLEALIAITIGGIVAGSAALLIHVMLRVTRENESLQTASFLNQATLDTVTAIIENDWPTVFARADNPPGFFSVDIGAYNSCQACRTNQPNNNVCPSNNSCDFGVNPGVPGSGSVCVPGTGTCTLPASVECTAANEAILYTISVLGAPYRICFDASRVRRDTASGNIVSSVGSVDPSTMRIGVKTLWGSGLSRETVPLVKYFTRNRSAAFRQTDWSGGDGQNSYWTQQNRFGISGNINFSVPGQITIQNP